MSLSNLKLILRRQGFTPSALKMALIAMMASRPRLAWIGQGLLRCMARRGELTIRYRCYGRRYRIVLRMSDLASDYYSARELAVDDIYRLEECFIPDIVLDGGGNTGLFTLRASARSPHARIITCEPLPRNADLIARHLAANGVSATLQRVCIGGNQRSIPFYCREANQGSFDGKLPYSAVIQVPVLPIEVILGAATTPITGQEKVFIKLDIEGMEMEALEHYLPLEQRAVVIVGELHDHARNVARFKQFFQTAGWNLAFLGGNDSTSTFRAVSPAALPLMPR